MKRITPQTAKTEAKLAQLKRDNCDLKDYWMLVQEKSVTIAKQSSGEPAQFMVDIPKTVFDKFIKFYTGN